MSTLSIINPSTEEPDPHRRDARRRADRPGDRAIVESGAARGGRSLPRTGRDCLRRFAEVVDATTKSSRSSRSPTRATPLATRRWEAGNVRDVLAYYSGAPERHSGRQIPVAGGVDITFYEPLGVVGIIVPWNFPMPIAGWGLGPALAAGNTVVLKPATLTPLTAMRSANWPSRRESPRTSFRSRR